VRQSWAWRRVSLSSSRARQRRKRSEKGVLEIPSGKVVGSAAQAIAPGGRKGWPPASPRTFAWSARAHHEWQQTTRHRRSFVARRGRDWPVKTASTFAVGARGKPTEPRMAPLGASDVAGNRAAFARLSRGPALDQSHSLFGGLVNGRADPGTALRNPRRGCLNFRRHPRLVGDHFAGLRIGGAPDQSQEAECCGILRLMPSGTA
jgi:hypothetical protein